MKTFMLIWRRISGLLRFYSRDGIIVGFFGIRCFLKGCWNFDEDSRIRFLVYGAFVWADIFTRTDLQPTQKINMYYGALWTLIARGRWHFCCFRKRLLWQFFFLCVRSHGYWIIFPYFLKFDEQNYFLKGLNFTVKCTRYIEVEKSCLIQK